jgi:histidine triad (HIT) family protein
VLKVLGWAADTGLGRVLAGWILAKASFLVPVERLRETGTLLAFFHPKPAYPFHVLIVPKKVVRTLAEFDANDSLFLTDLFSVVQELVGEFHLPAYRLVLNGGGYQDFPQLHFHLISPLPHPLSRGGMDEG